MVRNKQAEKIEMENCRGAINSNQHFNIKIPTTVFKKKPMP